MVSEGLLSPGWEERPAEPREPGWRVFPGLGGSGGQSSAWSCVGLRCPAWSRVVPPGPACPAWVVLRRCLWAGRQPLTNFTRGLRQCRALGVVLCLEISLLLTSL